MHKRFSKPWLTPAMLEYHIDICPKQRKRVYTSLKEVRTVLNAIKAKRGKEAAQRYYQCEHCNGWHMTSISKELQDEIDQMRDDRPNLLFDAKWKKVLNNQNN